MTIMKKLLWIAVAFWSFQSAADTKLYQNTQGHFSTSPGAPFLQQWDEKGYARIMSDTDFNLMSAAEQAFWSSFTLSAANLPSLPESPPVNQWYVCKNSTASTHDGSFTRPYLTIQAAINAIAAAGTNAANRPDEIDVTCPGAYAESLTFNSAALFNVTLDCGNYEETSVTDISSTATNTQLGNLAIKNCTSATMTMTGDVNGTNFGNNGGVTIEDSFFSGNVAMSNIVLFQFFGTQINGTLTTQNHLQSLFSNGTPGGNITVTHDNGSNKPNGLGASGTSIIFERSAVGNFTDTVGSTVQFRNNSRVGLSGGTCTNAGTLTDYGSSFRCNLSSSGTATLNGSNVIGTLTNTGTLTQPGLFTIRTLLAGDGAVNGTNTAVVTKDRHFKSTMTTVPTATVNANAGTGATCTLANSTDSAGTVTLVTGSVGTPTTGTQCTINFNKAYGVAPRCVFAPANSTAGSNLVLFFIGTPTTTTQPFSFGVAGGTTSTYVYNYSCEETQ